MSNTKIVIDKEDWDKIASEFNSNDLPTVTEIQIDQSIEEKIKSILNKYEPINKGTEYFYNSNSVIESMQEIATSQQIIEQLRVKEKEDFEFEHHRGNKVTKKELFYDHCLKCDEYFEDI